MQLRTGEAAAAAEADLDDAPRDQDAEQQQQRQVERQQQGDGPGVTLAERRVFGQRGIGGDTGDHCRNRQRHRQFLGQPDPTGPP